MCGPTKQITQSKNMTFKYTQYIMCIRTTNMLYLQASYYTDHIYYYYNIMIYRWGGCVCLCVFVFVFGCNYSAVIVFNYSYKYCDRE